MRKVFLILIVLSSLFLGSFKEETVLICDSVNATAYHTHQCNGLSKCTHEVKTITLSEAKKLGYKPCGFCYK